MHVRQYYCLVALFTTKFVGEIGGLNNSTFSDKFIPWCNTSCYISVQGRVKFDENGTFFQDKIRLLQYRRLSNSEEYYSRVYDD